MALFSIVANGANLGAFSEGATASVQFDVLDEYGVISPTGLPSASTVSASIIYLGSSSADITAGSFQYSMDNAIWQNVVGNSITINTGFPSFWLRVGLESDAFLEPFDALTFVVSQTYQSVGLADSWYVPYTFDITDTTAAPAVITLAGAATADVNEGAPATAAFNISGGPLTVATQINAQMTFVGTRTADFTGPMTITTVGGAPLVNVDVTALNGLVTLPVGTTSFILSRPTNDDGITEYFESVIISVAQTSLNGGLTDSWYVAKTLNLIDNAGAPAVSVTAVAPGAPMMGGWTPPATDTALEGGYAAALFHLSTAITVVGGDKLDGRIIGVGAAYGAVTGDYSNFTVETYNGVAWSAAPGAGTAMDSHGHITLPVGTTDFRLSALLTLDNKPEFSESLIFAVNQTANSKHLADSWWVQSTVQIADVSTTATTFTGGAGSDHFTATNAVNDIFVVPVNTSPAQTGYFDWITGLQSGDMIDIQGGRTGGSGQSGGAFTSLANALITANAAGQYGDVFWFTAGGDTYLLADTNGPDSPGSQFTATDTFIMLVGFTGITSEATLNAYLVNHAGFTGLFGSA